MNNRLSFLAITIWLTCAVFFMYEFLLRTILGTFEHQIISDLDLSILTFSILSSTAYQLTYGIMQIPVGIITDKLGLKKALTLAILVCALGVGLFGVSNSFGAALVYRVMIGFGASFGFLCLLIAVYDWLPHKHIGLFIGLSQFIGVLGPMLAAGPLESLSQAGGIDWRYVFIILAIIGVVLAGITIVIVKNNDQSGESGKNRFIILNTPTSVMKEIQSIFSNKQIWLIAVFSATTYLAIEYLSENATKSFLSLNGFDAKFSSYLITLAWLGYGIGCPTLGAISDRIKRRKPVMIFAICLTFVSLATIIFFPINQAILYLSFICLGLGASGQSIGFAIIAEQSSSGCRAAALGVNNFLIMLSVGVGSPIISEVFDLFSNQGKNPSITSYQTSLSLLLVFTALGVLISIFFIKETFCRSKKEVIFVDVK
ncbi:MFS transporter [Francisella philomiragia]|uniref:Major Facilitator Superfamily protein n=2 Tax=Francisella philomiragia TaxID=28110 RepID=A0AAW3DDS2_9GAMM|nr:MFS transporter [Francisella philomiragia]AJI46610.1 major Facilitator Superfamily protein [Francisella philomiragia]AJI50169.1 major Facilitator Superfamily protein [Francisella philomiragia]AJI54727.1 major Facilitator Superfamily protein [Francisella philomiragia]AJI58059.1 major Facilitator Superfamily protein [Francisella philomiragia]AJI75080.1 major Facilitator Superfamily protein [Francisella philomiragia subsp. philomiragia ATCC 25015]